MEVQRDKRWGEIDVKLKVETGIVLPQTKELHRATTHWKRQAHRSHRRCLHWLASLFLQALLPEAEPAGPDLHPAGVDAAPQQPEPRTAREDRLSYRFKRFGRSACVCCHWPRLAGARVLCLLGRGRPDPPAAAAAAAERRLKGEPVAGAAGAAAAPAGASAPPRGHPPRQPTGLPAAALGIPSCRPALQESRARHAALDYDCGRPCGRPAECEGDLMAEGDQWATRNLFIGNLDHTVSELELRRAFGKHGKHGFIEEVDIKRPARGQGAACALLRFQDRAAAHRAKVAMSGRVLGRSPIKVGYGKANPTARLWVGGLGPNPSLAALAREFDRFGIIRTIDHIKGDDFAYIQFETLDAAEVACAEMRGFPVGGPHRRLRVGFARAEETRYPPQYLPSPLPVHRELLEDGYTRHPTLDADLRVRDKTPPYLCLDRDRTFLEGDWTGPRKSADARNSLEGFSRSVRSRSGERWRGHRDRGLPKPWEDSGEDNRGRTAHCAYEERSWAKGGRQQYDCEVNHFDAGTKESGSSSLSNSRHGAEEWGHHFHRGAPDSSYGKKTREREGNYWITEAEPKPLEEPKHETKKLKTLSEYAQTLQLGWNGLLVLKSSCFPTSMYILEGDQGVINGLLRDQTSGSKLTQLKITQRLRLDQPKFDEVTRRLRQGSSNGYAVLLATQAAPSGAGAEGMPPVEPGLQRRLLRNLASYLKGKQAAGVISLPVGGAKGRDYQGMLYAFPPCHFSQQYLQSVPVPRTLGEPEEEHMLIVIVTGTARPKAAFSSTTSASQKQLL
ncbi:putative RNA-binding protein 15B [Heterocephalus glaber]|uniref:RNA-binding protein 15B n=2 Tax=Heterocephalus glaber TaxID=10181 RepID=A0AAX6T7P4_HETGA|nr:putative RNA-binding protein 15B [Heterocephalus glaber]